MWEMRKYHVNLLGELEIEQCPGLVWRHSVGCVRELPREEAAPKGTQAVLVDG